MQKSSGHGRAFEITKLSFVGAAILAVTSCTLDVSQGGPRGPGGPPPNGPNGPMMFHGPQNDQPNRPPPPQMVQADPAAEAMLRANAQKPAMTLVDVPAAGVTAFALEDSARSEARGMSPDGPPKGALLGETARGARALALSRGDCVTVIAHGGIGVMELDAFIVIPNGGTDFQILAGDSRSGPLGIVGGQTGCFQVPADFPTAEVWVQSRRGGGPVLLGIYKALR